MAADRQTLLPGPRQVKLLLDNSQDKEVLKKTVKNHNRFIYCPPQPKRAFKVHDRKNIVCTDSVRQRMKTRNTSYWSMKPSLQK